MSTATMTGERLDPDASAREMLNRRPAVGFAVGVVRDGALEPFAARSVADIATRRSVTEDALVAGATAVAAGRRHGD